MEIEAKFAVSDAETFQRLQAIDRLAGLPLSEGRVQRVRDTYLDTRDRRMLAAGYACRRRERDGEILITVKQLQRVDGVVHRREEFEITLPSDQPPTEWSPSPARDLVLRVAGDAELAPLCVIEQTRVARAISCDGRQIAELSLDDVRVDASDSSLAFFELEIELTEPGGADALAALATCLQDEWKLQPEPRSKFERALDWLAAAPRLLTAEERAVVTRLAQQTDSSSRRARALLALDDGASEIDAAARAGFSTRRVKYWQRAFEQKRLAIFPPSLIGESRVEIETPPVPRAPAQPGIDLNDSMAEAARKTLYFHFRRMLDHEAGTRAGTDIEETHDMRVATRRMRAALRVFDGYLDRRTIKPFAKSLRRAGRALGAVRDLDVFREKAQQYLDALPLDRQAELEPLLTVWRVEHDRARQTLLALLDSDAYVRFKEQFGEFLQTPGAGAVPVWSKENEPLPYRARLVLPVALHERYAAVRAYDEWVTQPDVPLTRLHQLRIASKGLRYTLEFFEEILAPEAETLIERLKRLQDHLGNLQDAVVTCNALREFLMWGVWGRRRRAEKSSEVIVAPGVAAYLAARQNEIQERVTAFPSVWEQISSAEFSQRLAAIVAAL